MPQEATLQYVYANGKPVSVIVPLGLWREIESERETAHAPSSSADITSVLDWEPLSAPDLRPYRPDEICWRGRTLRLRQQLVCNISREDGLVVIHNEPLGIRAYAESREFAIRDFAEEFMALWEEYASAPDEELTPDAIAVKQRLLALVDGERTGEEG